MSDLDRNELIIKIKNKCSSATTQKLCQYLSVLKNSKHHESNKNIVKDIIYSELENRDKDSYNEWINWVKNSNDKKYEYFAYPWFVLGYDKPKMKDELDIEHKNNIKIIENLKNISKKKDDLTYDELNKKYEKMKLVNKILFSKKYREELDRNLRVMAGLNDDEIEVMRNPMIGEEFGYTKKDFVEIKNKMKKVANNE